MSVTNPPTGASGPGSVGLGAVRGSLKRSVQASFEGESVLFSSLIILIFWVCHISRAYIAYLKFLVSYIGHTALVYSAVACICISSVSIQYSFSISTYIILSSATLIYFSFFLSSFSSYLKCPFFLPHSGFAAYLPKEGNDYPEVSTLNNDLPDSDSTQLSSAQLSLGSAELSTQRLFKSLIS